VRGAGDGVTCPAGRRTTPPTPRVASRARAMSVGLIGLLCCVAGAIAEAGQRELVTVRGAVSVMRRSRGAVDNGDIAVWLKPVGGPGERPREIAPRARLKIVQQDKRFEPRLLVVPVGSVVEFPNLDPFFHNVFSMFDGKRFDLGLYEAGSSRSVPFTTPGVCYIFCNIHPEMSAVVVVVDTPYFAVTNRAGEFTVPNVPPGRYALSVWHERHKPERPDEFPRSVTISQASPSVGDIRLIESEQVIIPHKNKYGHDYNPPSPVY
jgi:plastocyanin